MSLDNINCPIVYLHSNNNMLVRPKHIEAFLSANTIVESIPKALQGRNTICYLPINAGHDVFIESKKSIQNMIEGLLTGIYQRNGNINDIKPIGDYKISPIKLLPPNSNQQQRTNQISRQSEYEYNREYSISRGFDHFQSPPSSAFGRNRNTSSKKKSRKLFDQSQSTTNYMTSNNNNSFITNSNNNMNDLLSLHSISKIQDSHLKSNKKGIRGVTTCRGDFCQLVLPIDKSLNENKLSLIQNNTHNNHNNNYEKLLTKRQLEVLKRNKYYVNMTDYDSIGIATTIVPMKSILLARHERNHTNNEEDDDYLSHANDYDLLKLLEKYPMMKANGNGNEMDLQNQLQSQSQDSRDLEESQSMSKISLASVSELIIFIKISF